MTSELPGLDRSDLGTARRVGSGLVQTCRRALHPVAIAFGPGEQRAFPAALPGSTDNRPGAERKARTVRRFGRPSHEVELEAALAVAAPRAELGFAVGSKPLETASGS